MLALSEGIWLFNVVILVVLLIMVMSFAWFQLSPKRVGSSGGRYVTFSVMSFIAIGTLLCAYVIFLALTWGEAGPAYNWPVFIKDTEYDLANGFFTVLVGAAAGIFTTLFAFLKFKEVKSHV